MFQQCAAVEVAKARASRSLPFFYFPQNYKYHQRGSARLIYAVDAVVEVAEANNLYTLPSFHYPRQHDIVERSS
ncbi:hypothetical protein Tco_0152878 [Tanacetum coccineum]